MSFGKLYSYPGNPRTIAIQAVANVNNLDIEFVHTEPAKGVSDDYKLINKLGLVPSFVGADNFTLNESIAIAIYLTSQNEKTTLLGKTKQDYASILRWLSYFNTEVLGPLGSWFRPLVGRDPYNKKAVDDASKQTLKAFKVVEDYLLRHTYLVGDRITLADLFAAGIATRGFQYLFGSEWRQEFPNVTRWFDTIVNQPIYTAVAPKLEYLDKPALTNVAPKKTEAPKPAKAAKPAPAPAAEEEPAAAAPKPKHPCDLLPKSAYALDDFKRYFSNNEEKESFRYFWATVPFEDYSIWRVDYKYNDELTLTFMSNNLIGGFNARLEASRKHIFGSASVYGENNDSVIQGAFVIRGQEYLPVFDVAPDYESYSFTKLDPTKPEDREFVEAQWAWDRPVVVNGKEYKHADGKVFK